MSDYVRGQTGSASIRTIFEEDKHGLEIPLLGFGSELLGGWQQ